MKRLLIYLTLALFTWNWYKLARWDDKSVDYWEKKMRDEGRV